MVSSLRNVTFDCRDALALARFWAEVLGWNVYHDVDPEVLVTPSFPPVDGPKLLFLPVPEPRAVKNRVHLDIQPTDRGRDEEVDRLLELGATVVEDHRNPDGSASASRQTSVSGAAGGSYNGSANYNRSANGTVSTSHHSPTTRVASASISM